MKEARIKYYIDKIDWGEHETLPMMPGEAIKAVIKEYNMPAKAWGYFHNVIGIETKKQQILFKDDGTGISFLGLYNKHNNTYGLPESEKKQEQEMFETYEELRKEVEDNRDYENIKGLKAKVTRAEYDYFLEVLPPAKMTNDSFYMSEFLTGELTYKFTEKGNRYFCEVVDFREENKEMSEEAYLEIKG